MATESSAKSSVVERVFVGDHLALDFINTAYGVGPAARECLQSDADMAAWLKSVSLPFHLTEAKPGVLLRSALELREVALKLVEKRKAGVAGNPECLNHVLKLGSSYEELLWPRNGRPALKSHQRLSGADGLLLPVAQSIARLVSEVDFDLVRKCEGADCTLWFLDLTKAHSRRWCSPAVCGNRAKVAAFRARGRTGAEGK
jgi:predicted RNA-binding Zn ribbon-like protein